MKKLISRITITKSVSVMLHALLKVLLPVVAFAFVAVDINLIAYIVIILSKWRVLAVRSRYWGINFRTNMVDLIFGLSMVRFMVLTSGYGRLVWLAVYIAWILYIKKLSKYQGMILQAMVTQALGVSAILYGNRDIGLGLMVFGVWYVAYFSARHALSAFEEDHSAALAHVWGLFAVQLAWTLGHWQVWFWFVHQAVLLLTIVSASLITVYSLNKNKVLTTPVLRQISATSGILVLAILVLSDWQDKTF